MLPLSLWKVIWQSGTLQTWCLLYFTQLAIHAVQIVICLQSPNQLNPLSMQWFQCCFLTSNGEKCGLSATGITTKWFQPAAWAWAKDAYLDPWEEWVKNSINWMVEQVGMNMDDLYREEAPSTPKCKWIALPATVPVFFILPRNHEVW